MTTALQNKAWSILPKEFKEEVKNEYKGTLDNAPWEMPAKGYIRGRLRMMRELFGEHNLTSDVEGEEMLTVPRKKVLEKRQRACEQEAKYSQAQDSPVAREEMYYNRGIMAIIDTLFGPKCLPDKVDSLKPNVDSLMQKGNRCEKCGAPNLSICAHMNCQDYNTQTDPKAAEPKYHKGEKVRYNGYVYEVEGLAGKNRYALKGLNFDLDEDMIEPYTVPRKNDSEILHAESVKETRIADEETHLRNLSQETANCDKHFDNILKDSFRNERRLNIAIQIAQGALSNPNVTKSCADFETNLEYITKTALMYADALIAECELSSHQLSPVKKGGSHEKA